MRVKKKNYALSIWKYSWFWLVFEPAKPAWFVIINFVDYYSIKLKMSGLTNPFGATCFAASAFQLLAGCDPLLNAYERHQFFHKDESGKKKFIQSKMSWLTNNIVKCGNNYYKIYIINSSFIRRIVYDVQT